MSSIRLTPRTYPRVATTPSGTAVPVFPASEVKYVTSVLLQADSANTGSVYVGGADVSANDGIPLAPGESFELAVDPARGLEAFSMDSLSVLSASDSNIVRIFVLERV